MVGVSFLLVLLAVGHSQASCFGKDTGFTTATAKPTVTQPSRSDPTKVMVDYSKILKNPQCADSFTILVWADGTQQSTATKYQVDKNIKSKVLDIQPCVAYRYAVETHEKNTMGMKTKTSGDQLFKTSSSGGSGNVKLTPSSFHVTYHWDPVKKIVDLKMATISIARDKIPSVSCLDYIQITGEQVRSRTRSSSISPSRTRKFSWGHLGKQGPHITVGGASTLPANIGGRSYASAVSSGSSARGPLATQWSSSSTASRTSTSSRTSSTSSRSSSFSSTSSSSRTTLAPSAPNYGNVLPRPSGGATARAGPIKVQPPFLNPVIEMNIPVKDCAEYNFEVKLFSGRKEIAKVSNIRLPTLADVPGYVPPPLTSVMSISYGSSGKPVYGVKTASGVNAACLPAYFEAYDAYTHRLENEVNYLSKEGNRIQDLIDTTREQQSKSQEELLRKAGCVCSAPHLEFKPDLVKDKALVSGKYGGWFGHYHFKGMHAQRPYYQLEMRPLGGTPSLSGSRPPVSTTTRRPASAPTVPIYLYWEQRKKQWVFGPDLGSSSKVEFGSNANSLAKCPADPPATGKWQYKSSVLSRWKSSATLKVECRQH